MRLNHILADRIVPNLVRKEVPYAVEATQLEEVNKLLVVKKSRLWGDSAGKKLSYLIGGVKMNPTMPRTCCNSEEPSCCH